MATLYYVTTRTEGSFGRRLLAQMRSADRVRKCLLFGVGRTYGGHHETDASDPNRTWQNRLLGHLVGTRRPL
jgi:hypothetical protein